MIIGRGDIAKILNDREGFIFFACGESNRFELTEERKAKEVDRLMDCDRDQMFVYFSGLNIYYSNSPYTNYKKAMERLVKRTFPNYCIVRLGTITFGDNPNTLWNYSKRDDFKAQDTSRYLMDADEIRHWCDMIPKTGKHEMNITGRRVNVKDL